MQTGSKRCYFANPVFANFNLLLYNSYVQPVKVTFYTQYSTLKRLFDQKMFIVSGIIINN